ncbi:MAG: folate family ECF transporter S component [Defluviitaleaceae bacterium]|nr:folate family ECF transporter S component [Defluviitaleaceae bacterium]
MNRKNTSLHIRRIIISSMFLALAIVVRTFFRMYIPIFGESGMRLSMHGIFTAMPAILFGPIYGALVSGLTDFLGFHISPSGAFLPQLTLTATLSGFIRGAIWMFIKNRSEKIIKNVIIIFGVSITALGFFNLHNLNTDGITNNFYQNNTIETSYNDAGLLVRTVDNEAIREQMENMSFVSRMAIERTINNRDPVEMLSSETIPMFTTTIIGIGIFSIFLVILNFFVEKYFLKDRKTVPTIPLLIAMLVPAILINTINTFIFMNTLFPSWQAIPFIAVWAPRVIQVTATTVLMTYFVAILLGLLQNQSLFGNSISIAVKSKKV